jgi:hypothetical protein
MGTAGCSPGAVACNRERPRLRTRLPSRRAPQPSTPWGGTVTSKTWARTGYTPSMLKRLRFGVLDALVLDCRYAGLLQLRK